jgi:hypothetical protein
VGFDATGQGEGRGERAVDVSAKPPCASAGATHVHYDGCFGAADKTSLAALLQAVRPFATAQRLGLLLLQSDPHIRFLPEADWHRVVAAALIDGAQVAATVQALHGATDPSAIAAQVQLPVVLTQAPPVQSAVLQYAEYYGKPPGIRIYQGAMNMLNRELAQAEVGSVLGISCATPVFIAHELYHHFDAGDPAHTLSRRHRCTIFRAGRWRWTTGLTSLAEIAAGAFAQALLGLSFHPKLLDLISFYSVNRSGAFAMAQAVCGIRSCNHTSNV